MSLQGTHYIKANFLLIDQFLEAYQGAGRKDYHDTPKPACLVARPVPSLPLIGCLVSAVVSQALI